MNEQALGGGSNNATRRIAACWPDQVITTDSTVGGSQVRRPKLGLLSFRSVPVSVLVVPGFDIAGCGHRPIGNNTAKARMASNRRK